MNRDVIALFRDLADRSPAEREEYYVRHGVPAALRAEVESLLRFDGETVDAVQGRVAAVAARILLDEQESLKAAGRSGAAAPLLANGAVFGPYRIVRPLGRGGMGAVYEADEIESGRRVALKVLAGTQQNTRERERFEREGRLAASLNHPHCVFVFAASEIDGHPVIAMEVMQETLADRLKRGGPLAPATAVDAMLQLVAGLKAAAALGILHRDVKPSNCFVDAQGVVKIGDFGISRSQRPTEETAVSTRGQHHATPAYASPEQLRGAALDVRADIYSVGATLYELLTGRCPFEAPDLMALLMAVANDTPTAPRVVAPAVPRGLSAVVLCCLAKQPVQRFSDYDALAAALEPYSSTAPTAATLGKRCLAGLIDSIPIFLATVPLGFYWGTNWLAIPPLLAVCAIEVLYFAFFEGRWAATPGKAICGLMIVQQGGTPARVWQVVARATAYVMVPAIPVLALISMSREIAESQAVVVGIGRVRLPPESVARVMASSDSLQVVLSTVNGLMLLLLFCTARRRNGYAGLHDLVSRTRVVEHHVRANPWTSVVVSAEAPRDAVARLGPFAVFSGTVPGMPDGWRPGFDERLRRAVWIREVAPETPPVPLARRAINRATRLRWLAGRREGQEAWDAFEAVQGVPLDSAVSRPRTWQDTRWWLLDLAREFSAHSADDQPPRRHDRVWILDGGGAKLVDDPAVDQIATIGRTNPPVASFLLDVVRAARGSAQTPAGGARSTAAPPWPLRVHQFLERLAAEPNMNASSIGGMLDAMMRQRSTVTRGWRTLSLVVPLLIPVLWASTNLMVTLVADSVTKASGPIAADVRIAPWFVPTVLSLIALVTALFYVAAVALADAVVCRGGVMRLLGLELVTTDGRPASRRRVFARTALTWAPVLLLALIAIWGIASGEIRNTVRQSRVTGVLVWLIPSCPLIMLAGAIIAIVNPVRGIQDRLAGTWIVPR